MDTLAIKCVRAIKATRRKRLVVAGGVGANRRLREKLEGLSLDTGFEVFYPRPEFCTDNGAMIAYAGYFRFNLQKERNRSCSFGVYPRWSLEEIE